MLMFKAKTKDTQPATPPRADLPRQRSFKVRTRIGRSTGTDSHYACSAVRVLPSVTPNEVILQATDGKQATCITAPGRMLGSQLVPAKVLPARQTAKPVEVRLVDGQWHSSDGRIAQDAYGDGQQPFPAIGDVLPDVGTRPLAETPVRSERRRTQGRNEPTCIVLGIDADLVRKAAQSLGTNALTLFVPMPARGRNGNDGAYVTQPVAVCPANDDGGTDGVAVVMPLKPAHTNDYYNRLRETVIASEQRVAKAKA